MKVRNPRSDSAAAAVQAAQNAAQGPCTPPEYVALPAGAAPFWDAIMRNRPRHRWNDADLVHAAVLARAMFDVERLQREIDVEGDLLDGRLNPKHRLLEVLNVRAQRTARLIHVHTEATIGRVQDAGNTLELERAAEAEIDPLIPTLRAVS